MHGPFFAINACPCKRKLQNKKRVVFLSVIFCPDISQTHSFSKHSESIDQTALFINKCLTTVKMGNFTVSVASTTSKKWHFIMHPKHRKETNIATVPFHQFLSFLCHLSTFPAWENSKNDAVRVKSRRDASIERGTTNKSTMSLPDPFKNSRSINMCEIDSRSLFICREKWKTGAHDIFS